MITLDRLDEEKRERVIAPLRHLADAMVVEDTGSILEFIDVGLPVCRGGPLGCIGYCMGGQHVFRVAAHYPSRFKASVSFHGTNLVTESETLRILALQELRRVSLLWIWREGSPHSGCDG